MARGTTEADRLMEANQRAVNRRISQDHEYRRRIRRLEALNAIDSERSDD